MTAYCDVTMSCDSHSDIPRCIVNIVVVLVDVYGERWLAWLPEVCNHELPVSLLVFAEELIFQVWLRYHTPFVSYKRFLRCHLNANVV